MSDIDTRVVEMQFQNSQFEKNAAQSLATLGKLADASSMKGAVSGFGNLDKAIGSVDFSGLLSSIQSIQSHFTVVGRVFDTVLMDIVRKAEAYGMRIANVIIGPIQQLSDFEMAEQGWDKYNKKVQAVQTIMKATGEDIESVSYKLQDLSDYTDKTSYSYSQMVDNIGKFTANGVSLDDSIKAIEGVANVAAISGVGATDPAAGRAMYNLAQALASGSVQLKDWVSIEGANMATKQFKEQLIGTAKALGTLNEESETTEGHLVDYQTFRETLKDDWLNSEVLIATLKEYADSESEIGIQAYKAASEAKTFQDALGAIQDAISSTWSSTFELIFGNYEEATKVWTGIQDAVIDFLAPKNENRNNLLEGALLSPYKKFINLLGESEISQEQFEKSFKSVMSDVGIDVDRTLEDGEMSFEEYLGRLRTGLGSEFNNYLVKALKRTTSTTGDLTKATEEYQNLITGIFNGDWGNGEDRIAKLLEAGYDTDFVQGLVDRTAMGETIDWAEELKDKVDGVGVSYVELDKLAKESGTSLAESISTIGQAGGFYLFWDGIREYFEGFVDVINTIKEAFQDIFPPLTAKRLYEFINAFNQFAYKVRPTEATLDKIKRAFSGLFDILKLGGQIIGSVVKGVTNFIKTLKFGDKSILDYAADIGDALRGFAEGFRENQNLQKITDGITKGLQIVLEVAQKIIATFQKLWDKAKELFNSLFKKQDSEETPLMSVAEDASVAVTVLDRFKKIGSGIGTFLANFGTMVWNAFKGILEFVKPLLAAIGTAMTNLWEQLKANFTTESGSIDFGKIFESLLAGGIGAGIAVIVKKVTDLLNGSNGLVSGITDAIKSITDLFGSLKHKVDTSFIESLAKSLLILAAAIFILASIDMVQLAAAIGAVSILLNDLIGFVTKLSYMGTRNRRSMAATSASLIAVASAILVLSVAVKIVSKIDIVQMAASVGAIVILLIVVKKVIASFSGMSEMSPQTAKGIASIKAVAYAILILAKAVKMLGELDIVTLAKGLVSVIILLKALTTFIQKTSKAGGMSFGKSAGVVLIAASLLIIQKAVKDLGSLDLATLAKGLLSVAVILTALAAFTIFTSGEKGMLGTAAAMVVLGAALRIITNVITKLGSLPLEQWALGIVGMALAIGIMVGSMMILSTIDTKTLLEVSAAMLIFSVALLAVTPAILAFASLSIEEVGVMLIVLIGLFTTLGVAGVALGPLAPTLIAISGALALLGLGVAAFGAGMLMLSMAIIAVSAASASVPAAILAIGAAILALIPLVLSFAYQIILGFIGFIKEALPLIVELVVDIIVAICDAISRSIPAIIGMLGAVFDAVIPFLATYIPLLVNLGLELLAALLQGIADNMIDIINAGADLIVNFCKGMSDRMDDIVNAAFDLIQSFLDAINDAISTKAEEIVASGLEIAGNLVGGVIRGIGEGAGRIWTEIKSAVSDAYYGAKEWLGISSPSKKFRELGKYTAEGMAVGLNDVDVRAAGKEMAVKLEDGFGEMDEGIGEKLSSATSRIAGWLDENMDVNPVITPVLDLSDVTSGVGDISSMLGGVDGFDMGVNVPFDVGSLTSQIGNPLDASGLSSALGSTDQSTNITNTFNITGDDPTEIANKVSDILNRQTQREATVWA